MTNSRLADVYYNRYQDMLSLRKAQERLAEVRKEQERNSRINASAAKPKILKNNSSIKKKESKLKTNSRQGKSEIPKWD